MQVFLSTLLSEYFFREAIFMSVNKTRSFLYKLARLLGDFSAVSSGSPKKMTRRVRNRVTYRAAGKAMRKLLK